MIFNFLIYIYSSFLDEVYLNFSYFFYIVLISPLIYERAKQRARTNRNSFAYDAVFGQKFKHDQISTDVDCPRHFF